MNSECRLPPPALISFAHLPEKARPVTDFTSPYCLIPGRVCFANPPGALLPCLCLSLAGEGLLSSQHSLGNGGFLEGNCLL